MKTKALILTLMMGIFAVTSVYSQKNPTKPEQAINMLVQDGKITKEQASEAITLIQERDKKSLPLSKKGNKEAANKIINEYNNNIKKVIGDKAFTEWQSKIKELRGVK